MTPRTSLILLTLGSVIAVPTAFGQSKSNPIHHAGSGIIRSNSGTVESGYEIRQEPQVDAHFLRATGNMSPARVPSTQVPTPLGAPTAGGISGFRGFAGMTHADQRLAGGGNQFSLEPPDQGLAVGNGFVVEAVNLAAAVYNTSGTLLAGPVDLNSFYGLAPTIVRSGPTYGPFVSDPRVLYDAPTGRWFMTVLEIDTDPATGALMGHSSVLIAVSSSNDPTGGWALYALETTNNNGAPVHQGCPCFGDQPLIGADQNGFYISTNEFSIAGPQFNGAQIYAISKAALENGTANTAVGFDGLTLAEGPAYSVMPTITPAGAAFAATGGGTEYFASALDFAGTLDNRVAVWAMTNTTSLNSAAPKLALSYTVVNSQVYGLPPAAEQQNGPLPLADLLKEKGNPLGVVSNEHLALVDSDDDRMQQAVYVNGSVWTALGTVVKTPNGPTRTGIAWFILTPHWTGTSLSASMANQGYLALNQENLTYPSIGVNAAGKGVMTFTVVGPDYFPSVGYATLDATSGAGPVRIAAAGASPDDGFTGYSAFGGARVGRWGDYTAAVADADGSIWIAAEFIPNAPRTLLANWGTFIGRVPQ